MSFQSNVAKYIFTDFVAKTQSKKMISYHSSHIKISILYQYFFVKRLPRHAANIKIYNSVAWYLLRRKCHRELTFYKVFCLSFHRIVTNRMYTSVIST